MSRHELDPTRDADILGALANCGEPRPDEQSDDALIAGALAGLADPSLAPIAPPQLASPEPHVQPSRAPVVIAVAAAVVAVAAATVLVLFLRSDGLLGQTDSGSAGSLAEAAQDPKENVNTASEREREAARHHAPQGDEATGSTGLSPADCESIGRGVSVCIDGDARVAAANTDVPGPAKVTLHQGRLHVSADADGDGIDIGVDEVHIDGRGTVFDATVAASASDERVVVIVVSSGIVSVTREGQDTIEVRAGDPFSLSLHDEDADEATGGEQTEPDGDSGGVTPRPRPTKRNDSPNAMLARAQKLFGSGKTSQAVRVYELLVATHPASASAKAARVSLGRIELSRGRAKRALAHFDAYLAASAGSLVEEARYGRIRALRKLGRTAQERRSIAAFVRAYPKSIYVARLQTRAEQIDTP